MQLSVLILSTLAFYTAAVPKTGIKADRFDSPSIDFQGNEIKNVALSNVSFQNPLQHLAVRSIEIQGESTDRSSGIRLAVIDHRGGLSTAPHIRFDDTKDVLQIDADIDLNSHKIMNFQLEKNSILHDITLQGGQIHSAVMTNVTFENPSLRVSSITVDEISVTSFENNDDSRNFLISDKDGRPRTTSSIQESDDGILEIHSKTVFRDMVDFGNATVSNVNIESGQIIGDEIDFSGRNIQAESLTLLPYFRSKRHFKDSLVTIDSNGELKVSNMTIDGGWMQDAQIEGIFHFRDEDRQGKIINAAIEGGTMKDIEELSILGDVECRSGLIVREDVLIDGSLTVGGSVLGSGPYVDVSDSRLKTDVNVIKKTGIMDRFQRLQAVSYHLLHDKRKGEKRSKARETGFIAQDVQEHFPSLVSLRPDGYLGIQYARFVPLIIEVLKDVDDRIRTLEEENSTLREMMELILQQNSIDPRTEHLSAIMKKNAI